MYVEPVAELRSPWRFAMAAFAGMFTLISASFVFDAATADDTALRVLDIAIVASTPIWAYLTWRSLISGVRLGDGWIEIREEWRTHRIAQADIRAIESVVQGRTLLFRVETDGRSRKFRCLAARGQSNQRLEMQVAQMNEWLCLRPG